MSRRILPKCACFHPLFFQVFVSQFALDFIENIRLIAMGRVAEWILPLFPFSFWNAAIKINIKCKMLGLELLLVRVLGGKFIATLLCFARNLLMHQSGEVCVFFIKMLHSINLSSGEDTGGPGARLTTLSFLTPGRSGRLSSRPVPALPAASIPDCGGYSGSAFLSLLLVLLLLGLLPLFLSF